MMHESVFHIPRMDCPCEERMVRLALDGEAGVAHLVFDLPGRRLTVHHDGPAEAVLARLTPLGLGAALVSSRAAGAQPVVVPDAAAEAGVLKWLLAINAAMFVLELGLGWVAQSAGLIADSLDMFADAAVYGLSLYAVGHVAAKQRRAAHLSGWLQIALALGALLEVGRRLVFGSEPEPPLMMAVAALALAANVTCLWLLARHRQGGAHMRASWIFSTNDVLANLGVIAAGLLVAWTGAAWPDWVVGTAIAALVFHGGLRILRL